MTTELKFCKDCKHYRPPMAIFSVPITDACYHPSNMCKPDLVSGRAYPGALPIDLRRPGASCGEEGLMFEAKPLELEEPGFWSFLTGWR